MLATIRTSGRREDAPTLALAANLSPGQNRCVSTALGIGMILCVFCLSLGRTLRTYSARNLAQVMMTFGGLRKAHSNPALSSSMCTCTTVFNPAVLRPKDKAE